VCHSDATYYVADENAANYAYYRAAAEPAIAFVGRLRELADRYFAEWLDGRAANYEDVANLAKQITDALSGEYENPALLPLLLAMFARSREGQKVRSLPGKQATLGGSRASARNIVASVGDACDTGSAVWPASGCKS